MMEQLTFDAKEHRSFLACCLSLGSSWLAELFATKESYDEAKAIPSWSGSYEVLWTRTSGGCIGPVRGC